MTYRLFSSQTGAPHTAWAENRGQVIGRNQSYSLEHAKSVIGICKEENNTAGRAHPEGIYARAIMLANAPTKNQ